MDRRAMEGQGVDQLATSAQVLAHFGWRAIAAQECQDLLDLLADPTFSDEDLADRLKALVEYLELDPNDTPTAIDPAEAGAVPEVTIYSPGPA